MATPVSVSLTRLTAWGDCQAILESESRSPLTRRGAGGDAELHLVARPSPGETGGRAAEKWDGPSEKWDGEMQNARPQGNRGRA